MRLKSEKWKHPHSPMKVLRPLLKLNPPLPQHLNLKQEDHKYHNFWASKKQFTFHKYEISTPVFKHFFVVSLSLCIKYTELLNIHAMFFRMKI